METPSDSPTLPGAPKPWWQSRTILSLMLVAIAQLAKPLGVSIDPQNQELIGGITDIATALGLAAAGYGRVKASGAITLTRKTAPLLLGALFCTFAFTGCAGGHYVGPSLGISAGYQGISVGLTLLSLPPTPTAPSAQSLRFGAAAVAVPTPPSAAFEPTAYAPAPSRKLDSFPSSENTKTTQTKYAK